MKQMKMLTRDLEDTIDELHVTMEGILEEIGTQESIIEDAEACIEDLQHGEEDLRGELYDLERLKDERDVTGRKVGKTVRLSVVGGNYSVVRDPREKLRFSDEDYSALVLTDDGVWGCWDWYPHQDSILVFLTEVVE